jgi:hypothetical protein
MNLKHMHSKKIKLNKRVLYTLRLLGNNEVLDLRLRNLKFMFYYCSDEQAENCSVFL